MSLIYRDPQVHKRLIEVNLIMNKISCLTLIWLFCLNIPVFAATEKVVLHNNKFGGITKLVTYFNENEYNKDGIQKIIYHYDNRGHEKLVEIFATNDYSTKVGLYKTLIYYKEKGRIIEIFSTDIQAAEKGYYKLVLHLSDSNKLEKQEYYFTEKSPVAMLGIYKRVIYYDSRGEIKRVIHLDKVGNIAMIE